MAAAGPGWASESRSRNEAAGRLRRCRKMRAGSPKGVGAESASPPPARSKTMNIDSIQQPDDQAAMAAIVDIRHISTAQLAQLGLQQIAYVKPVVANGAQCFAIHA